MNIPRLSQITMEDRYSRKNIREKVLADILASVEGNMSKLFSVAAGQVYDYLNGRYYPSKQKRINHLNKMRMDGKLDEETIVIEILMIVMPVDGVQTIQSVCGRLLSVLGFKDTFDGVKAAAELLAVVCESDLYDIIPARDSETGSMLVRSNYRLEEHTLQFMANTKYLPPMICEPQYITSNDQSAYLTFDDSIILGSGNHHLLEQALDVVNIANGIKLSLDEEMLKYTETSKKELDTHEKEVQFNRMVTASKGVYQELLVQGNVFHLTWKYDKRGRFYSQAYHCNIQGTEFKKSILNLAKKEIIT